MSRIRAIREIFNIRNGCYVDMIASKLMVAFRQLSIFSWMSFYSR